MRRLDPDAFALLVDGGVVAEELLPPLPRAAGMRNVLAHEYEEIDPDVVAGALPSAVTTFTELRQQVARLLLAQPE